LDAEAPSSAQITSPQKLGPNIPPIQAHNGPAPSPMQSSPPQKRPRFKLTQMRPVQFYDIPHYNNATQITVYQRYMIESLIRTDRLFLTDITQELLDQLASQNLTDTNEILKRICHDSNTSIPTLEWHKEWKKKTTETSLPRLDGLILDGKKGEIYFHAVVDKTGRLFLNPLLSCYATRVDREFGGGRLLSVTFTDATDIPLQMSLLGRSYHLLIASPSSLRSNRVIYWAQSGIDCTEITCDQVRAWTGITPSGCKHSIAKYVSRIGQYLSSSTPTITLQTHQIEIIDDIIRNEYEFTDGSGYISYNLMEQVKEHMKWKYIPSVIQIRIGMHNIKGILVVSPHIHDKIQVTRSMAKNINVPINPTPSQLTLDICIDGHSTFQRNCSRLNREFILNMWSNGVPEDFFISTFHEHLQQSIVDKTQIQYLLRACQHQNETSFEYRAVTMLLAGFKEEEEPKLETYLRIIRINLLKKFIEDKKLKIPIPNSRCLYGIPDPTGILQPNQMYGQLVNEGNPLERFTIRGKAWIGKPPCIHAGDGRIVEFVDVPDLRYLKKSVY
jgi:hypothetical protein